MKWLLKNFILYSDMIGKEPSFRLGNSSRNKTILGGLLSIAMFVCVILGFLYFGQELYLKKIPNTIFSNLLTGDADEIKINQNTFTFYFSVNDFLGNFLNFDDGFLEIKLLFKTRYTKISNEGIEITEEKVITEIPYSNCTEENFVHNLTENKPNKQILNEKFSKMKCIHLDNLQSNLLNEDFQFDKNYLSLKGNVNSQSLNFIQIQIKSCSELDSNNCKKESEIFTKLNGAYFAFGFNEYLFDYRKIKNFADSYVKQEKIFFSSEAFQYVEFQLTKFHFFTDTGYLIEDFEENIFYQYEVTKKENFVSNLKNQIEINLIPSIEKKHIYRKYYKIQNLLAEIGGLSKSFLLIAIVLNYFNNETKYFSKLIDNLFDGDDVFRYFQYHRKGNKKLHKKFRDSVILTTTKKMESYVSKKNNSGNNLKNNFNIKDPNNSESISISNSDSNNFSNNFLLNSSNKIKNLSEDKNQIVKPKEIFNSSPKSSFKSENKEKSEISEISKISENNNDISKNDLFVKNLKESSSEEINNHKIPKYDPKSFLCHTKYFNNVNDDTQYKLESEKLKKNKFQKENFYKLKQKNFYLTSFDLMKYIFCPTKFDYNNKRSIFFGAKEMINTRTDIIYILKKNLEFDRFKNLILSDYQLLLLDSLTKFMLDPERVKLVDFESSSYEKMIDAYMASKSNDEKVDRTLTAWVRSKFHFLDR